MWVPQTAVALLLGLAFGLAFGLAAFAPSAQASPPPKSTAPHIRDHLQFGRHLRNLRFIPPPPRHNRPRPAPIPTLWLDQPLDHFNPLEKRTWRQRYYARTDLHEDGGPVFIFIGGESPESAEMLDDGVLFMTFLAEKFKAKMFDLEHRFYGESRPTEDLSSANLQYLSADQALADLAYFIEYLIEKGDIEEDQKVAVFGGSYPGNLAAWARMKYPHLIHAAVSSSAPVRAKADFFGYMEVVARSLDTVAGPWCARNVRLAMDRIVELLKTEEGRQTVKEVFQIRSDLTLKLNLDSFFETLSSPFAGAVQNNRDSEPYSAYNIKYICSFVAGDNLSGDEAMEKLSNLALGTNKDDGLYYDWSYATTIQDYKQLAYRDSWRQWLYQTCTEFGYFQTFDSDKLPFPRGYNDVEYDYQMCKDIFGDDYDKAVVEGGVRRSNLVFGGDRPDVTNVIFVNGDIDPWHALGILEDINPRAQAVLVKGGSHCADMNYPDPDTDSQYVTAAHEKIHKLLREALYEIPNGDPVDG